MMWGNLRKALSMILMIYMHTFYHIMLVSENGGFYGYFEELLWITLFKCISLLLALLCFTFYKLYTALHLIYIYEWENMLIMAHSYLFHLITMVTSVFGQRRGFHSNTEFLILNLKWLIIPFGNSWSYFYFCTYLGCFTKTKIDLSWTWTMAGH